MASDQTYWAADDAEKAAAAIDERGDDYYKFVQAGEKGSLIHLWRASNRACFAGFYTGGELGLVGKQAEFRTVEVNEYGNLHQHLFTMITAQRPAFEARTETIDAQAQQEAPVGVAVVETALREKGLEAAALNVADTMIRAGEGWGYERWNPEAGQVYSSEPVIDPETKQPKVDNDGQPIMRPVNAGDVEYRTFHPLDVARDPTRPHEEQVWFRPRRRVNKWDLAAAYPELADEIIGAPSILDEGGKRPLLVDPQLFSAKRDNCDDIWVYDFMHKKTPALPDGRLLSYVTPSCVLFDGPLPTRGLRLYRSAAKDLEGSAFGYSLLWDILAPQMALNNILSHITTLAADLGAVVWEPEGMGQSPTRWKGILTILKGGTVPPQVLDLLKIPAELFKLVDFYIQSMERMSGINSIYRGQAAEGQRSLSGAAYALFAARAIEFGSRFQGAYAKFMEDIATGTIQDYQDMGRGDYLVSLAGEGNSYRVQAFKGGSGDDPSPSGAPGISKVSKIVVKLTNPMQSTQAGRMALFDSLAKVPGAITTPETALQVLNTGRLEPATQSTQRELENIAKENELLAKGEQVFALITDREWLHIPEHSSVAASPEARKVPGLIEAIRAHVEMHMANLSTKSPTLLAMQGAPPQVVQLLMASMAPPPMPGGPPSGTGAPAPGAPSGTPPMALDAGAAQVPGQPRMPTDPLTGEESPMPPGMAGM